LYYYKNKLSLSFIGFKGYSERDKVFALMWIRRLVIALVVVIIGGSASWAWWHFNAPRVSYLTIELDEAVRTLLVSGRVIGDGAVPLSFEQPGQILDLAVREGDTVSEGELLASLDSRQAEDLVRQSEIELDSVRLTLERLMNRELPQARENLARTSRQAELADSLYREALQELYEEARELKWAEDDEQAARLRFEEKEQRFYKCEIDIEELREAGSEWQRTIAGLLTQQELYKAIGSEVDRLETESDVAASQVRTARLVLEGLEDEDIRQARLNITRAENSLEQARRDLEETGLRAPFSGVISAITAKPGQYTTTGQEVLILIPDSGRTYLEAQVDEEFIGEVSPGQTAIISSTAFPDRTFDGKVDRVSPTVDPSRGTFTVRFVLDQYEPDLVPDLSVGIEIITEEGEQGLILEQGYTFWENDKLYVFVADNGTARRREIKIEDLGLGSFLVTEGLSPGEWILADTTLQDGQRIRLND